MYRQMLLSTDRAQPVPGAGQAGLLLREQSSLNFLRVLGITDAVLKGRTVTHTGGAAASSGGGAEGPCWKAQASQTLVSSRFPDLSLLPLHVALLSSPAPSPTPGHIASPRAPRAASCVSYCCRLTGPLQNLVTAESSSQHLHWFQGPEIQESLGRAVLAVGARSPQGLPEALPSPAGLFRWRIFILCRA